MMSLILALLRPVWWLASSLLTYSLLVLTLIILWRTYKTYLVRRVSFLKSRLMKPVDSRQAVMITGATSGIGLAVAKHLVGVGYSVIATYYDSSEAGYEELRQIRQHLADSSSGGQKLLLVALNVRETKEVEQAHSIIEAWLEKYKLQLCGLINNAGMGSLQPFSWLQRVNIFRLVDTNITGSLLVTREFLPLLARCESGARLIYVSSGLGLVPGATYATYGMTKCALVYFSRCMNLELKERYNIQSVAILPHNFIKNTNICAANVKTNELAWDELTSKEKKLYKREFDQHLNLAKALEKATREHARTSRRETSDFETNISSLDNNNYNHNDHANSSKKHSPRREVAGGLVGTLKRWASLVVKFLQGVVCSLNGGNSSLTLEESGALECFEDALRLRDPPEQMFAGNTIFQLLIGSLLTALPNSCSGLLSASVVPSLYK